VNKPAVKQFNHLLAQFLASGAFASQLLEFRLGGGAASLEHSKGMFTVYAFPVSSRLSL
jgi:hypothetical protein